MFTTRQSVMREAKKSLALVHSRGWDIHVWENVDGTWGYCLTNGPVILCPSEGGFTIELSDSHQSSFVGLSFWKQGGVYSDPNEAIATQAVTARKWIDFYMSSVLHVEGLVTRGKRHIAKVDPITRPWRCGRCGRQFEDRIMHRCNSGFRKRNFDWHKYDPDRKVWVRSRPK